MSSIKIKTFIFYSGHLEFCNITLHLRIKKQIFPLFQSKAETNCLFSSSEVSTKGTLFPDEQQLFMPVRTFRNQVGISWLVCIRMSQFPNLVLRARIKVGNEEKFFAMCTSLLNLEDGFYVLPCTQLAAQERSSLACLPK